MKIFWPIPLLLLSLCGNAGATYNFWIEPQVGVGGPGFGVGAGLQVANDQFSVGIRRAVLTELCMFCWAGDSVEITSLLIGGRKRFTGGFVQVSTGISRLNGVDASGDYRGGWFSEGDYSEEAISTLALPLEIGVVFAFPYIGFGIHFFSHFSNQYPLSGVALTVPIGYMGR